jgi:hypothetical protein
LRKGFEEPNDGVREQELSCLPSNEAGEISFVPAITSVLGLRTDIAPRPGVKLYQLTSTLCQPLSLSYLGSLCVPSRIKILRLFDHCFAQVPWTWRRSCILEFSLFCGGKLAFLLGLDSSCLIKQSNES